MTDTHNNDFELLDTLSIKNTNIRSNPDCGCNAQVAYEGGIAFCIQCGFECKSKTRLFTPHAFADDNLRKRTVYDPLNRFILLLDSFAYIREAVPTDVILFISNKTKSGYYSIKMIANTLNCKYPNLVNCKFECYFRLNGCQVPVISHNKRIDIINDFKLFTNAYHIHTKGRCSCPSLAFCLFKLFVRHGIKFPVLAIVVPRTLKDYDMVYNIIFNK